MTAPVLQVGVAIDFAPVRGERFVDRLVDLAPVFAAVDELGFRAISAGESYPATAHDPMGFHAPNSLMVLTSIASRVAVPQLIAGTALLGAWPSHRLCWDAALAADLLGGRLVLGLGLGPSELWATRGVERSEVGDTADATIAALRQHMGAATPPIWIGGGVSRSARRAAELGDGYIASSGYTVDRIGGQATRYRDVGGGGPISVNRACVLAGSRAEADTVARQGLEPLLRAYAGFGTVPGLGAEAESSELTTALSIVGTADDAVATVNRYIAAGVTHLQLRVAPGRTPISAAISTLSIFALDVLPRLDPLPSRLGAEHDGAEP